MNEKPKTALQWHPAFYAGIQIEFEAEADKLIFENEHQLGTKPKEIDVLIIKKNSNEQLQKNIGKIFRKHNIIEYKSPEDYLSIDDFYLVYAYACIYKSDTPTINAIPAEEITISFVTHKFPQKLVEYLKQVRKYTIEKQEDGVYYVKGDFFPIQIIHTKQLTDEQNFWLHSLTNDIQKQQDAEKIFTEYQKHQENKLYTSVMNIIISANEEQFKEVTSMCEALNKILNELAEEMASEMASKMASEMASKMASEMASEMVSEIVAKEKQELINEKNSIIAEKDAIIAKLEAQLAMQSQS